MNLGVKHRILTALCLCLLAACNTTASLEKLREKSLNDNQFHQVLAKLYRGFAESELKSYDWWSSKYFADKGLMAANGQTISPENPDSWRISEHDIVELQSAYSSLNQKLTPGFKASEPVRAATLQFTYDCWVEQQEEAWDTNAIDVCKNRFYSLLDETDTPTRMGGPLSTSYLMHFDWGANEVSGMARDELHLIASHLKRKNDYEIIINGHADRSGDDDYNMELSQARAEYIRSFLIRYGVPASRIQYFAFGESDPKVFTEDGVRQRANRRVELFIE